jgi:hypothetical protein
MLHYQKVDRTKDAFSCHSLTTYRMSFLFAPTIFLFLVGYGNLNKKEKNKIVSYLNR